MAERECTNRNQDPNPPILIPRTDKELEKIIKLLETLNEIKRESQTDEPRGYGVYID